MPSRAPAALGTVILGLLAIGVVAAATKDGGGGPDHPDRWDPRVADLAAFVEEVRGRDFDRPVHVDFLTPAAYTEETTSDEDSLDDGDRTELDRFAGELRAIGVATGPLDLFAAYNQVSDGGTLAFYDPATERVRVRGTTMTIGLEVTLVHELTHALQDQHFDLERLYADELDSSEATAFRGLIEGDAVRVEGRYTQDALTAAQREVYAEEYAEDLEASQASTEDVPPFVNAGFGAPYLLGQPFAIMLANQGGNDAVDAAFREPPDTEEHLFDPASFLADEESEGVELGLADDVEVFDDGPFGSPSWYLMLAERIDPKVAFDAALGWNGDAYAVYEQDDRTCITAAFAGDSDADEAAMADALDQWLDALPGGQAEVVELDGRPGFVACDPGEDVDMELTGRAESALFLPSLWGYLVADAAQQLDAEGARCYARRVLDQLTYDEVADPEGTALQGDAFQRVLLDAFQACA